MSAVPTMTLADIFKQIDDTHQSVSDDGKFVAVEKVIEYSEKSLKSLQDLKQCLEHTQVVSKGDVLRLVTRVKKIYTTFGVFDSIRSVWENDIRPKLNDGNYSFKGSDLVNLLLIKKTIIELNKNIFASKRSVQTGRAGGTRTL
jgi:hypothetical protein